MNRTVLLEIGINLKTLLVNQLPSPKEFREGINIFLKVIIGALLISPLVAILPLLGWDWYYFFNEGNPAHNLSASTSPYPPFAKLFLSTITWMYWRDSLAILNSITLVSIAIATWKQGGRYGSIALALFNAPVLFLLWIGHPDSISLLGVLTGFVPFIFVKPPLAIWSIFSNRKIIFWAFATMFLSLIIWPLWILNFRSATPLSEPAFGWPVSGWPIGLLGIILFMGSDKNPFRLMAAGTLITPYVLPYHLAILAPGIGKAKGYKKILIWAAAWMVALATGLGRPYTILSFVFPLAIYFGNYTLADVQGQIKIRAAYAIRFIRRWKGSVAPTT